MRGVRRSHSEGMSVAQRSTFHRQPSDFPVRWRRAHRGPPGGAAPVPEQLEAPTARTGVHVLAPATRLSPLASRAREARGCVAGVRIRPFCSEEGTPGDLGTCAGLGGTLG